MEGFENPTMSKIFTDLLTVQAPSRTFHNTTNRATSSNNKNEAVCPVPVTIQRNILTSQNENDVKAEPTSFLKTLLLQERKTVDSLISTAKRIGPVTKQIESDIKAPIPRIGKTLQGFAVLLFFVSYISLAIIGSIAINVITKNGRIAGGAFAGFVVLGFILLAIVTHLG
jgi:hypothetical protein